MITDQVNLIQYDNWPGLFYFQLLVLPQVHSQGLEVNKSVLKKDDRESYNNKTILLCTIRIESPSLKCEKGWKHDLQS